MALVFDTETDNLLPHLTKIHCAGAIDSNTNQDYWFNFAENDKLEDFLDLLDSYDAIAAHNAYGFDVAALHRLSGNKWKPKSTVYCTKVMSQVLQYNRFGFGHSLKKWGEFFGDNKIDYTGDFSEFTPEMFEYMKQDVRLGTKVYRYLMKELKNFINNRKSVKITHALRLETEMDRIMTEQSLNGWKFNKPSAKELLSQLEKETKELEDFINPYLGLKITSPDGSIDKLKKLYKEQKSCGNYNDLPILPQKTPKYTKLGNLHASNRNWFDLDDSVTVESSPILGDYCRIDFEHCDVGNTDSVKDYIYSIGWKPDEWNYKRINGSLVKTSAKLTSSSLEPLGDIGKALDNYYTYRARRSVLEGWFDYIDEDSRLHGDVFNIGTPTFRQTHKIIANLPSGGATLGKEIRSLFITEKGYKLVSADSAACQLRLLAHFMGDDDFTDTVLNGDIHQMNADIIGCTRQQAKRFIFAFLYGAGPNKLSGYIGKSVEETKKAIKRYKKALPKLAALIYEVTGAVEEKGYLIGLDDRPVFLDRHQKHKSLNYLIQSSEAIVMKQTIVDIHEGLEKAGIDSKILLFYHDEVTYEVRKDQTEEAKNIIIKAFEEAPKKVGVNIMTCGDCKIGDDYFQVH
jgi:DNA polymerase I-like protein with 3'-5' exonuclease and polymerase domains